MPPGERICTIYKITNKVNGKVYVGQTWGRLGRRFTAHCSLKSRSVRLRNAVHKHGRESFTIEPVCYAVDQKDADFWENHFIERLGARERDRGYNVLAGGQGAGRVGLVLSEETREKMRKAATGRLRSEEHCRHLSEAIKALPEEKRGAARKGKTFSPEYRAKLSAAQKGKKKSPEHVAKMAASRRGLRWKTVDGKRVFYRDEPNTDKDK